MNIPEKYTNEEYLQNNPTWHSEDSPWKAEYIAQIIDNNNICHDSICEIGCGAGEILKCLHVKYPESTLKGYEISPDAYEICKTKTDDKLSYELKDFLTVENEHYNIIMMIDIIEHLEDYFSYLRNIHSKSDYKILHVPLEFFAFSAVYHKFTIHQRKNVGHIHVFTKDIVVEMLSELGYEIIDYFYTPGYTLSSNHSIKDKLLNIPRKITYAVNKDLAVRIFGGYSLMILIK